MPKNRSRLVVSVAATALVLTSAAAGASASASTRTLPTQQWQLDPSFGVGGIVQTDFPISGGHYDWAFENAVQPDGRIVVSGVVSSQVTQDDSVAVARYLPSGRLDPSFGSGGEVTLGPHALYRPTAVALQEIGGQLKILLAVETTYLNPTRYRCTVMRLNADGSLDTDHDGDPAIAFGRGGKQVVAFADNSGFCGGMALTPAGNIVVTVESSAHGGDVGAFQLLGDDGALDPGFGTGGRVTISAPGYQVPRALTLQTTSGSAPDIVIGGLVSRSDGYDWALWRLTADGEPDPTFGTGGRVVTPMRDPRVQTSYDAIDALTVTQDGNIVAAGRYRAWPKGAFEPEDTAAVAEYLPDGTLDQRFGDGGRAHIPWDSRGDTEADDVSIDAKGRILFAGPLSMPTSGMFLVGGFDADGRPDTRFGAAGYVEFVVRGGYDAGESLVLDSHGRLVVAGIAGDPSEFGRDLFAVARLRLTSQATP